MFKKKFPAAADAGTPPSVGSASANLPTLPDKSGVPSLTRGIRAALHDFLSALRVLRVRQASQTLPRMAAMFSLLLLIPACRTLPPLSQADLSQPGWTVFSGQALWKPKLDAPEIAGELLVATNRNGSTYVQFTKTPFPLMIAQTTSNSWQIEAPVQNRRFARSGAPPHRVMWFLLPRALASSQLPSPWRWTALSDSWRLENPESGERLEGFVQWQPTGARQ